MQVASVAAGSIPTIVSIWGGARGTLALKSDGSVWAWGSGTNGELGNNDNTRDRNTPVHVFFPNTQPSSASDTTGVFRPSNGLLYLKNSNTTGFADIALNYGLPGDYPVVGDWDGDGKDTTGVFRPSNGLIYLKDQDTTGFADDALNYGRRSSLAWAIPAICRLPGIGMVRHNPYLGIDKVNRKLEIVITCPHCGFSQPEQMPPILE